jgi:hypothetical protein
MSSWPLVSNGEVRPSPRLPVLDLDDLCGSFGCPEWRDGEFPHLAKHVLIVRESGFICSASMRDPANWKEMLKDYLSLRHLSRKNARCHASSTSIPAAAWWRNPESL